MEQIRVTVVGGTPKNLGIGKTCFIKTYIEEKVCKEAEKTLKRTTFESSVKNVQYKNKQIELTIYDTASSLEDLDDQSYPETNVFLLAYSIGDRGSFEFLTLPDFQEFENNGFFNEIRKQCPDTPIILIGLKDDFRNHEEIQTKAKPSKKLVSSIEGCKLANKLKCESFFECSIYKQEEVKKVFDQAIKIALKDDFYILHDELLNANSSREIFRLAEALLPKYEDYQFLQVKYPIS